VIAERRDKKPKGMPNCFKLTTTGFKITALILILLTWRIWRAPNNASKWQIGFNSAFKGLNTSITELTRTSVFYVVDEAGNNNLMIQPDILCLFMVQ